MTTPARAVPIGRLVALIATVAGLAVSTYLTVEHYSGSSALACPESATVNCLKVTTSKYSVVLGVPVAVWGLAFFVAMAGLLLLPARLPVVRLARLGAAAAGVLTVLVLVYLELFEIDAICLWCTAVHVLTVVVFAAVLWEVLGTPERSGARG